MDDAQPLVLVVDDDESIRRSLRWLLVSAGYSVATFSSGTDMLEHRPPEQPAVLLMDVRMPDMTGLEVKEQLSKMGRDMVTIFRDRVQEMAKKGMTLQQIKAARPSLEYDGIYGATTGNWTTDRFLETVYRDVTRAK